jgi:hypothetical protein
MRLEGDGIAYRRPVFDESGAAIPFAVVSLSADVLLKRQPLRPHAPPLNVIGTGLLVAPAEALCRVAP